MVHDHRAVAGAWSFLHDGDCGIYAVGTSPGWRRLGFARALVEHVMADARHRGARTASLQSTEMGRPLYESLHFEPAGRYEEWLWKRTPLRSGSAPACPVVRHTYPTRTNRC
jgi:GNAT superfamily N-acetyltransferase